MAISEITVSKIMKFFVAINDLEKTIEFAEIKRQKDNINFQAFQQKVSHYLNLNPQFSDYKSGVKVWGLVDI